MKERVLKRKRGVGVWPLPLLDERITLKRLPLAIEGLEPPSYKLPSLSLG